MAAAAAMAQANSLAGDGGASDTQSVNSSFSVAASAKRKRDLDDDDDTAMTDGAGAPADSRDGTPASKSSSEALSDTNVAASTQNGHPSPAAPTTSTAGNRDEKRLIHDYFEVLSSYDESEPPILKRPLPELESSAPGEPQAKRQKSSASTPGHSIANKVANDAYALLDDLVLDIAALVSAETAALGTTSPATETVAEAKSDAGAKDANNANEANDTKASKATEEEVNRRALARIARFREKAHELYRRETAYPASGPLHGSSDGAVNMPLAAASAADTILTVFGNTPQPRQLFSSLPHRNPPKRTTDGGAEEKDIEDIVREDGDLDLDRITLTRLFPAPPPPEKARRVLTFGELFPSPRNLPALQPPKVPKSTTKSTTLGFYHPELEDKSKYRSGSYFSQHITAGQWLDYSNATPSVQIKTKQRERAQSLAGHKPSTSELEMSEMDSLFRGAFSSFAPSKDDSAAIVPAAQVGRMWWQRVGHHVFQQMLHAEYDGADDDVAVVGGDPAPDSIAAKPGLDLDEEALQRTIEEWDDTLIDPSLEEVMGQKNDTDKDVEDLLQDVSDLIVTLASYQRNRNLTLPTSQDRFSADPVNGDMLRNGTLAQQPSEEEMVTYQTLKAQLALLIQSLPPYAVARLNSDKLDELNISTKIEVRSEEYHGVMEEDEAVVRARQAAAQPPVAVNSPARPPAHRAGSVSNASYGQQFGTPNRASMPANSSFYQTPGRNALHRPPQGGQQFRPANGYNSYTPGMPKAPAPQFRTQPQGVPMYSGAAGGQGAPSPVPAHMSPQRVVSQPVPGAYGSPAVQPGAQQPFRYPQGYAPPGYPQQQPQQQPGMPPQQQRVSQGMPFSPTPMNGRPIQQPPFTASPQPRTQAPYTGGHLGGGPPGQQQPMQGRPPYNVMTPQMQAMAPNAGQRHFSVGGTPGASTPGTPGGNSLGPVGYHTVMDQPQQQRLMEQARARASAHERSMGFTDKISQGGGGSVGQMGGLAGVGLGAPVDGAKLAAARASNPGGVAHGMSPMGGRAGQPMQPTQPMAYQPGAAPLATNGTPQHVQSPLPTSISPAPSGGFARPA